MELRIRELKVLNFHCNNPGLQENIHVPEKHQLLL